MEKIFQKNIQALALKNPDLAKKVIAHIITDAPNLINENGFYNFVYQNKKLHNPINPLAEAKEIFLQAENTPISIHLIYGLGLGYLFQVAAANSKGTVILFESDLNILKSAFMLVDFSNDILKNNIYIADTINSVGEYIYQKSNIQNIPLLLTTPAYRELESVNFEEIVIELQRMIGRFNLDRKYTQQRFFPLLKNIVKNLSNLPNEIPLDKIKGVYSGKTAVVVSAGPTLDRNIETLKKYRDRFVLIVVGTAMKTLAEHNITPDFLCIIEAYDSSKQIAKLDLSEVNFVTEPYSHVNLRKFKYKQVYTHFSQNMPLNSFWSSLIKENNSEYISKGTVSYTALNTARILGCSKIIIVGQDLAYIAGQCYSRDSAYKDLECAYDSDSGRYKIIAKDMNAFANALSNNFDENVRLQVANDRLLNLNNSLCYVKGISGDLLPTESVYATFITPLSEFAENNKDIEFVNTSLVGAQIDGYKNLSLEEALKDSTTLENKELISNYKLDLNILVRNVESEICKLNNSEAELDAATPLLKSFNNNLRRYRMANTDVLKSLKNLSAKFLEISNSNKDNLFDFITVSEKIDLESAMKMAQNFDTETLKELSENFTNYFENAKHKINIIRNMLNKLLEKVK